MKKMLTVLLSAAMCLFLSGCVVVNTSSSGYFYDNYSQYISGGAEIDAEIQRIDVDWVSGAVTIVESETEVISFTEECSKSLSTAKQLHYWYDIKTKTLFIKFCESSYKYDSLQKDLYIYVPKDRVFNEVNIDVVSADTTLQNVHANVFDIDSVSGNIKITTDTTESIYVNSVSSSLEISAVNVTSIDFDTVSGNCDATFTTCKQIDMDSVSGDLNLYLPEELGFYLEANTFGKVDYTMEVGGSGKVYTYGSKELKIDFDSTNGNVHLF